MATDISAELAGSLSMEEIPMKLRCAICNLLAVNALRTPCCDQNICESCRENLEDECLVCLHRPLDKSLCSINKALRTTVKAFLKKKGIERDTIRKKEEAARKATESAGKETNSAEEAPKHEANAVAEQAGLVHHGVNSSNQAQSTTAPLVEVENTSRVPPNEESCMDIPQLSIESSSEQAPAAIEGNQVNEGEKYDDQSTHRTESSIMHNEGENSRVEVPLESWPSGTMAMPNGGLGAMPMDFTSFMPNGVPMNHMAAFPGTMGMGIDPMMMPQMLGGFGGPGIGMNGMNGMNMGMGFNSGQGTFGGFNGQNSGWMSGQENFNANAFGASGNFGQGGYNMPQGNYNHMNQQQYPNHDFQHGYNRRGLSSRGRRGRGGFYAGRGYGSPHMNQGNANGYTNHRPPQHQQVQQSRESQYHEEAQEAKYDLDSRPTRVAELNTNLENPDLKPGGSDEPEVDPKVHSAQAAENEGDIAGKGVAGNGEGIDEVEKKAAADEMEVAEDEKGAAAHENKKGELKRSEVNGEKKIEFEKTEEQVQSIQTFISGNDHHGRRPYEHQAPRSDMPPPGSEAPSIPVSHGHESQDSPGWGRGSSRGHHTNGAGFRGRGGYSSESLTHTTRSESLTADTKVIGVPGAPTGPKALRQGGSHVADRGRGFQIVGRASGPRNLAASNRGDSKSPSSIGRASRSHSPSPNRQRSSHHKSHRHRSRSASQESKRAKREERHHRRSSNYYSGREPSDSREVESESARRSSYRSHRHHRDRSHESRHYDDDRRHRRRRSHSPTSIVPTPTSARPQENVDVHERDDSSRKRRDRGHHGDDEDRPRERKRSRRSPSIDDSHGPNFHGVGHIPASAPQDPRDGRHALHVNTRHEILSSSSNKATGPEPSLSSSHSIPTGPRAGRGAPEAEKDVHTLEREARDRERLVKEMQRRAVMEGGGGKRRTGKSGRRVSYNNEDENIQEARTRRGEEQREASRWA